jgi:trigger factor
MMKKKICLTVILAIALGLLGGCGNSGINPDKYVTLGDYKNLSVDVTYMTFTEDDVESCAQSDLNAYVEQYDLYEYQTDVSANTVENGSVVNIDYVGKMDGEVFDGGSQAGAHLEIGSDSYIDGFEDGLLGKNVGENVELQLTFPEDYSNTDYAGKDVVFSVSINSIDNRQTPEFTDDFIASLGISDITTYDAYLDYLRDYLQNTCDDQNDTALETAIWDAVCEVAEVSDPPQELIDEEYEILKEYYEEYAEYYSMDLESFVTNMMGMDMDTFESSTQENATEQAKDELIYMALAKAEDIKINDEVVREMAESEYATYGCEDADALIEYFGEANYTSYVRRTKVMERLKELVTVVEGEPVSLLGQ